MRGNLDTARQYSICERGNPSDMSPGSDALFSNGVSQIQHIKIGWPVPSLS